MTLQRMGFWLPGASSPTLGTFPSGEAERWEGHFSLYWLFSFIIKSWIRPFPDLSNHKTIMLELVGP